MPIKEAWNYAGNVLSVRNYVLARLRWCSPIITGSKIWVGFEIMEPPRLGNNRGASRRQGWGWLGLDPLREKA
jgi:hypothetical protein